MLADIFKQHLHDNVTVSEMTSIIVHIRTWTVCSPYVFTFYVTFIPVTVCECHVELKATKL